MDLDAITAEHTDRVDALDPLLPKPPPFPAGAAVLTAGAGVAVASYQEAAVGTAVRTWEPARKHVLDVRLAGPDQAADLGALLDRWLAELSPVAVGDPDSAAVVEVPSRDTESVLALVHRGFVPSSVVAVRSAGPVLAPDVAVRPATPDDLDVAVALNLEVVHYDASFGKLTPRSDTAAGLASQLRYLLAAPSPLVWLAERDGRAVGLAHVQVPPDADWARRYTRVSPVGYFSALSVTADARGTGVGSALAARAHATLGAAAPVTLLHHALPNPRSTPFWYRHGYRPLWTIWLRRPAIRAA